MKAGKTLTELAAELERQNDAKRDFIADSRRMAMVAPNEDEGRPHPVLAIEEVDDFGIRPLAHRHIGQKFGIPAQYYDRMLEHDPALLATNVNAWWQREPKTQMVRTLDGEARALLSDRYRPLDNFDLATVILPKAQEMECRVESCEVTETKMYIKCVTERIQGQLKRGDIVQAGFVASNSEVGAGSIKVELIGYEVRCANGWIVDKSMRRHHVGRRHGNGIDVEAQELFTDETRRQDDKAFWMKVRDTVDAVLTQESFNGILQRFDAADEDAIEGDPMKAVEVTQERFGLNEDERGGVLRHLIEGGNLSRLGLGQAITRHAQDVGSYDRSTEMEAMGGQLLELPKKDWDTIALAEA